MGKNRAAVALGRLGGKRAAEKMTPEQRADRARKGGLAKAQRAKDRKAD